LSIIRQALAPDRLTSDNYSIGRAFPCNSPVKLPACERRPAMKRTASAVWQGTLKEGKGTLSTPSAVLRDTPYSFRSRFADGTETNPEELIAAAHAGCFSMAL